MATSAEQISITAAEPGACVDTRAPIETIQHAWCVYTSLQPEARQEIMRAPQLRHLPAKYKEAWESECGKFLRPGFIHHAGCVSGTCGYVMDQDTFLREVVSKHGSQGTDWCFVPTEQVLSSDAFDKQSVEVEIPGTTLSLFITPTRGATLLMLTDVFARRLILESPTRFCEGFRAFGIAAADAVSAWCEAYANELLEITP